MRTEVTKMNSVTNPVLEDAHEAQATVDDGLSAFVSVRPRLFGIAYRILGSGADAEDIVQDVWARWQTTDRDVVLDQEAFLTTATTRLAINLRRSARSRRETYVGPCLPEPVDTSADPGREAEQDEALKFAVLLLLEKLSHRELAAYVFREAFDYSYRQIADILQLSEANARQLVTRARKHIADGRHMPVNPTEQECLLIAFMHAAQKGDFAELEHFLAQEVSYFDGDGQSRDKRIYDNSRRNADSAPPENKRCTRRVSQNDGMLCLSEYERQVKILPRK
jgi:RNA polymerase sigma-70 factor, ECF subfamily